jgi:PPK2 family polyphosphate:nucleotide phosphotransferase
MKKIEINGFRVTENIRLLDLTTDLKIDASDKHKIKMLAQITAKLSEIQDTMYAHNKYSVLIVLQGMDTSGKDSLIREVFKDFNPRGTEVHSFKVPSANELEHDFLWRHYIKLPEKGKFTVFNRSHYENVLVTRVHPEYLLKENLPNILSVNDVSNEFWETRMLQINSFEKHLTQNGMIILKFFLHLSKEEQRKRLLRRLEEKKHNWKFSPDDLIKRERWDLYQQFYEDAINKTSTDNAPWFIIPADDKEMARYIVGKTILEEMEKYKDIKEPELDKETEANMAFYKKQLTQ